MAHFLVTGGAGFIGSTLTEKLIATGHEVLVVDALTYAGRMENLPPIPTPGFSFIQGSICDQSVLGAIFADHQLDGVINVAAESHVDRSIDSPADFVDTNIVGTQRLLDASLAYWRSLDRQRQDEFRYLQVSTDEVYGSISHGMAAESAPFQPNSPYAASKAAADHLVRAYHVTYGLPTLRTHGCNTFGRRQFPEKIIPLFILRALSGMTLPVYGKGLNVREWISVDDHADGLIAALQKGRPGHSYNLGSGVETSNLDLVGLICEILGDFADSTEAIKFCDLIEFVQDRPGHDLRYAMDVSKSAADLNWRVTTDLRQGVIDTVEWYLHNKDWWLPITEVTYDLSRLGVGDE